MPNVTEILFAIGAGPQVVAVSTYDVEPPEVRSLPTVGALIIPTPSASSRFGPISSSPTAARPISAQLKTASIPSSTIAMAASTHHGDDAIVGGADRTRRASGQVARALQAGDRCREEPRRGQAAAATLLVFGREPGSLRNIYASAGSGFLHDMLVVAGGEDVLNDIEKESAQVSTE